MHVDVPELPDSIWMLVNLHVKNILSCARCPDLGEAWALGTASAERSELFWQAVFEEAELSWEVPSSGAGLAAAVGLLSKQVFWQEEAGGFWEPVQQEAGRLRQWDLSADKGPVLDAQLEQPLQQPVWQPSTSPPARRQENPDFCSLDLGFGSWGRELGLVRVWGVGGFAGCQEGLQCQGWRGLESQILPLTSR